MDVLAIVDIEGCGDPSLLASCAQKLVEQGGEPLGSVDGVLL